MDLLRRPRRPPPPAHRPPPSAPPLLLQSRNAIRDVLERLPLPSSAAKHPSIPLGQGDPCAFHFLKPHDSTEIALLDAVRSKKFNGYAHSAGLEDCRRAVAEYHSRGPFSTYYTMDDVIITVGCTQAIEFSIAALATPGSNILLPRPGFPLYETFCSYLGIAIRYYDLLPERGWEVDLEMLELQVDRNTVAIIICNPSNPCGAVFSHDHLSKIIDIVERLKIPIISDEIYGHIVFGENKFVPIASLARKVPVLTLGGLSKRWLVPGWRLGWILISDQNGVLAKGRVVEALMKLAQLTVNTSTIVQAAVPSILKNTPKEFFQETSHLLQLGAELCCRRILNISGLDCPCKPQGAMFIMVRINTAMFSDLSSDTEFASALAKEESVIVLPGSAFGTPNWMRMIFAAPTDLLEEAWDRIESFCKRHFKIALQ